MGRTPPGQTRDRVFRLVRDRLLSGSPPTVREVRDAFGFRSVQTAREHLEGLVQEGRLLKQPGIARGYRLALDGESATASVPLLGRVQAGALDAAIEDCVGYIPVQTRHPASKLFALRVSGDSMTGAGILDGDVVIVRRQRTANSGEIVVALVGDEATVKRMKLRGNRVELHPENPAYEVISPDPRELSLLGKVIEVRRRLENGRLGNA
jgi:repressor LexA